MKIFCIGSKNANSKIQISIDILIVLKVLKMVRQFYLKTVFIWCSFLCIKMSRVCAIFLAFKK